MEIKKGIFKFLREDIRILFIIGLFLAALSLLIGRIADRASAVVVEVQPAFLQGSAPRVQPTVNRLWEQYDFEKSFVIDSSRVTKPMMMRVDTSGNVYVLDWDDFRIKVFSPDADLLKTFGEGKSVDRGEFRN